MDFQLFRAVLKRYKRMVIVGIALGVVLAVLSYGTPGMVSGKPGIVPRGAEVWQGQSELLLSQAGDPYGRATQQLSNGTKNLPPEPVADTGFLASLSAIYAAIGNGNQVQSEILKRAGVPGTVEAAEVDDVNVGTQLPLVTLTSSSPTQADAAKLADVAAKVLQETISQQQVAAGTSANERVDLQLVKTGSPATLAEGHKKSVPMLVLFAFIAGTIALAFIRNNNSEEPLRSTRRPREEIAYAGNGAGNGNHVEVPHPNWARTTGHSGLERLSRHRAEASAGHDGDSRPAEDLSATADKPRAWASRKAPQFRRGAAVDPEPRD